MLADNLLNPKEQPNCKRAASYVLIGAHLQGSGSWMKMDTAWGANFQTSSAPSPPLDLRITPNDGSAPLVATCASLMHTLIPEFKLWCYLASNL